VSSDSMKKPTATSHGNNRFTDSPPDARPFTYEHNIPSCAGPE